MATRSNITGLLRLLASEVAEAAECDTRGLELRVLDGIIRTIEDDVERVRQELDELLRQARSPNDGEPLNA